MDLQCDGGIMSSQQHPRRSRRYEFSAPIDISLGGRKISFGNLIDISKEGLGFRASPPLNVGETYLVSIREFGAVTCRILHCSEVNRYGATMIMSDGRKRRLARKLEQLLETTR
jgi:hypothetical protein